MQSLISYTGCMLILMLPTIVSAQVPPADYTVRQAVPFNGAMFSITNTSNGCTGSDGVLTCNSPSSAKLTDGNFSPSDEQFLAFSRQGSSSGRLLFFFASPVSSVVLSFYNSPNVSIGLPEISVLKGINQPVPYFFSDNDDLTQNDSQLKNVTLSLTQEISTVQLDITFPNSSKIDWLLLNEVQFYTDTPLSPPMDPIIFKDSVSTVVTLGTDNIQSTVSLSCTVVNAGSFEWQWLYNNETLTDSSRYQVWIGDATRTSTLTISELTYSDQGIYTCRANRQGNVSSGSERTISLILQDDVMTSSSAADDSTVTVSTVIVSSTTISSTVSSVSSTVSTVSSVQTSTTDQLSTTAVTQATSLSSVSSTPTTTAPPPATAGSSIIVPVAAGVSIGFVVLLIVGNILVITLLYFCVCKRRSAQPKSPNSKELVEPIGGSLDPIYSQPDFSTQFIGPYSETVFRSDKNETDSPSHEYNYINHQESSNAAHGNNNIADTAVYQVIPEPLPPPRPLQPEPLPPPRPLHPTQSSEPSHSPQPEFLPPPRPLRSAPAYSNKAVLQENPQYVSANGSIGTGSPSHLNSANFGGSDFNIYATPNIPPPVPDYKGSMFSIDLDPSQFQSDEPNESSENQQLLPFSSIYADPEPIRKTDVLEVSEENITTIKELGVGQFGKVFLAHTLGLSVRDLGLGNDDVSISILVAVKVLQADADDSEREAFEKEIKFMSRLRNENIVRILGVCLHKDAFIMMEYMENGDLNQYLQRFNFAGNQSTGTSSTEPSINLETLVYVSLQVAGGMRYLAGKNFVHRDLATRNCLVGQKFLVKIADFGMSRQLYDNNYYRIRGRAMLPIRWMAKECFYGRFSEKTDVWAFGVVMWEIFTLCKCQPFDGYSDQDVIDNAIRGEERVLLSQPEICPDEVYHVMLRCWVNEQTNRATFEEIHGLLAQIHAYL